MSWHRKILSFIKLDAFKSWWKGAHIFTDYKRSEKGKSLLEVMSDEWRKVRRRKASGIL